MYRTLVSPNDLHDELPGSALRIVDCRFDLGDPEAGERQYRDGHLPGAVYAHLERDLSGPLTPGSGRHPLPERERLTNLFGGWAITRDTQVVAYDASGGAMAARLWWLLRWMGHAPVAVLDGGWQAWCAAGFGIEQSVPQIEPVEFVPAEPLVNFVSARDVEDAVSGQVRRRLVDARAPERFRGEVEPIDPVAGHIPGAVNIPFAGNLDGEGRFLDRVALQRRFETIAAENPAHVVHYCGSGVTACHNVLAMEHAGLAGPSLYAGSWSEWIRDPAHGVSKQD